LCPFNQDQLNLSFILSYLNPFVDSIQDIKYRAVRINYFINLFELMEHLLTFYNYIRLDSFD